MWTKLDDDLHDNPKALELSEAAGWLATRMWSYAGRHGTDGHISVGALRTLWHSEGALEELIARGWVHERGREAEQCSHEPHCCLVDPAKTDGWVIHDYLDRNPSQDENSIHVRKKNERKSSGLRALVFDRDGGRCRYCGDPVNRNDHKGPKSFQLDHVSPVHAIGAGGVVSACKDCNTRKKDRTPTAAGMKLRPPRPLEGGVDDPTLHPELDPISNPTPDPDPRGVPAGSGLDRVGSGQVGTGRDGTAQLRSARRLIEDNPYLRSGRIDPALDPAFTSPGPAPPAAADDPPPQPHPPPKPGARSQRPRKRTKGRRRR